MKVKYNLHFGISFLAHFLAILILLFIWLYKLDNTKEKFTIENYNTLDVDFIEEQSVKDSKTLRNIIKDNAFKTKASGQKIKKDNFNKKSFADTNAQKSLSIPILNNANIINYTPPVYPYDSLLLKEQGTVSIMLLITTKGKIIKSKLYKSSGHNRLDNAVLDTVKMWSVKNIPLRDSWVRITVNFVIK